MLSFLPSRYLNYINEIDVDKLYEVRLRVGFKIKIKIADKITYLGNGQVVCIEKDIDEIIKNITERSLYAYNESLKKGFLTTKYGVRVGIAGQCVFDNGQVITIKKITSINIRIPHEIFGCSDNIYPFVCDNTLKNTIIVSPPFFGKTTILKDLIRKLDGSQNYSILVVDERAEFSSISGENIDSIKYCNKEYAFSYGIRSMSPNVIITDELCEKNDWLSVQKAVNSGVKVIASCHAKNLDEIKSNVNFITNLFERYVILDSDYGRAGIVKNIYNKDFELL